MTPNAVGTALSALVVFVVNALKRGFEDSWTYIPPVLTGLLAAICLVVLAAIDTRREDNRNWEDWRPAIDHPDAYKLRPDRPRLRRLIVVTSMVIAVLLSAAVAVTMTLFHEKPQLVARSVLQVNFDPIGERLPILIRPRAEIAVVHIFDDGAHLTQHGNSSHVTDLLWPGMTSSAFIPKMYLSNTGGVDVFGAVLKVRVSTGADNIPGAVKYESITLPAFDLRASRQSVGVVYFANRSSSEMASVWVPPNVTAQAQGDGGRTQIPIRFDGLGVGVKMTDSKTGESFIGMYSVPKLLHEFPKPSAEKK